MFVLHFEENLASHRYVIGKGGDILSVFSDNCGYSSLASGGVLKVSGIVEPKALWMTFSVTLNPFVYFAFWPDHLALYDFVTLCIGHLENDELYIYSKCWHIALYIIKKSYLLT